VTGDNNSGSDCYNKLDSSCPKGTIYNDLNLSTTEASLATSLIVIGAWIGCLIGSKPSEVKGRKWTLLANNVFFLVGAALTCSGNLALLFIGRFISGLGVGISSVVPPVTLSEIAAPANRGVITTMHQLVLTLAIFIVSIVGYGFVTYVNHGWQYVQAFAMIPSFIMLAMSSLVPESPKWLLQQYANEEHTSSSNSHSDTNNPMALQITSTSFSEGPRPTDSNNANLQLARVTLKRLRNETADIDAEINMLLDEVRADAAMDRNVSWSEVFACRQACIIGCGLLFFQAMTGINSVVFYSTTIFGLAGFNEAIVGTACFGITNFLMTFVAAWLIDQTGRRILLLSGTYVMLAALVVLSSVLVSTSIQSSIQGAIAVLAVLIYVCGYAVGLGAVCWTITSEIMPTRQRIKAVSLFLSINWGCNLVIGLLTLTAIDSLGGVHSGMDDDAQNAAEKKGVGYLYLIFAVITACSLIFIHLIVPETKGKSPDQLNKPLLSGGSEHGKETDRLVNPMAAATYGDA